MRALWLVLGMLAAALGAARAEVPAKVFGQLPQIADVAISPDGSKLALAVNKPEGSNVTIIDLAANKTKAAATAPDQKLRGVGWASDDVATFRISQTLSTAVAASSGFRFKGKNRNLEYYRVGSLAVNSGRMALMLDKEEFSVADTSLGWMLAPVEGDPGFGRMVSISYKDGPEPLTTIYRVRLETGAQNGGRTLSEDVGHVLLDRRGEPAAFARSNEKTNAWRILAWDGGKPRQILEGVSDTGAPPSLVGLLPDGRAGLLSRCEDCDTAQLHALDLSTGAREPIGVVAGFDVDAAILDPVTHEIVGYSYVDAFLRRQVFFDPVLQAGLETALASFPEKHAELRDWSKDRSHLVLFVFGADDPGRYMLLDTTARKVTQIGEIYPELPPEAIAPTQSITYKARDGVKVSGYLTLPRDREPKGLPLVLLVHGGPHARDEAGYDYWAQFLAARGFAVLQANYRGSDGFGRTWMQAGMGQWAGLMQTDVEDGSNALVKAGLVDPKRVCIMGASYGGYAAFVGAALTPERYACAVAVNGVSDVELMLKQTVYQTGANSGSSDWWTRSIGSLKDDAAKLRAISPINAAASVKAPLLVLYSDDDSVVDPQQSQLMIKRLQEAGRPVQVGKLKGEDHWLSTWEGRTQVLEAIDAFLKQAMPGG